MNATITNTNTLRIDFSNLEFDGMGQDIVGERAEEALLRASYNTNGIVQ